MTTVPMTAASRFVSVDALRGLTVAAMLLVNNPGDWSHVYPPLLHAQWHGCTPTDLIFPMFLFVVGVSIALGLVLRVEAGDDRLALTRTALWRAARIVALGLFLHVIAWWWLDREVFRPWGVLQRIGLCFAVAALCAIHLRPRVQWALCIALLAGYAGLLAWGGMAPFDNAVSRVDTTLLGPMVYQYDAASGRGHDPEGMLSTVPAVATTLLGLFAGAWLRAGRARRLLVAAAVLLPLGWLCAQWQPMNKNLWSPSYVLWTAGWAMLAIYACHRAFDLRRWPPLGHAFGINAIAAYAGSAIVVYASAALGWGEWLYRRGFVAAMPEGGDPRLPSLLFALAFVATWWLVVAAMRRMGVRIRL
jgi:predicted acyltransferase